MLMAQADELQEVSGAGEGTIVVAMGLKHVSLAAFMGMVRSWFPSQTYTGDTLVQSAAVATALEEEGVVSLLAPPPVPPPVFFCTVEPSSASNQKSESKICAGLPCNQVSSRPGPCSSVPLSRRPQPQGVH